MTPVRPSARLLAAVLPILLLAAPPAPAKPAPAKPAAARVAAVPAQAQPWLYRGSDIPQDKEWVFGELANGLRYAVRKNGVPPGQVSIRIRIDAGSLHEQDSERGFAHLLEHLVFRQSKYLGEAQAIPTWQRLGATFGNDTNAETTPTQTVFKLDLPDATPQGLDESFKLLSGMMAAPTLCEANIRTEVPIVLAEKRERGGAAQRVQEATQATFYAGQLLAQRSPIGTEATLNGANQASVRAFHARWYRPENAVIVVAGDVDPAVLEGAGREVVRPTGRSRARRRRRPASAIRWFPPVRGSAPGDTPVGERAGAGRARPAARHQLRHPAAVAARSTTPSSTTRG